MPDVHCFAVRAVRGAAWLAAATMLPDAPKPSHGPGDQDRNDPPGAGGQAAHGHAARAEPRGENREAPRGLGIAHRGAPRGVSAPRLGLSRRRVRRRPRRAETVRRRRRDWCDRSLFDQQLLAGADGRDAAVLRIEPWTRVVHGRLPGRTGREVLRHRSRLEEGRQNILRLHAHCRGRSPRFQSRPLFLRGRRGQVPSTSPPIQAPPGRRSRNSSRQPTARASSSTSSSTSTAPPGRSSIGGGNSATRGAAVSTGSSSMTSASGTTIGTPSARSRRR